MNHKTKTALRFGVSTLIVLLATGCKMSGEVSDKDRNKIMTCKDTRDGETFSFNTDTITNLRVGVGAPHTFNVVTTDGKSKSLSSDMEAWLKCEKIS